MEYQELSPLKRALLEKWLKGQAPEHLKTGIGKRPADSEIRLSLPQQRQLFLELLERSSAVNNLSVLISLSGHLNLEVLEKSAQQILLRHDTLRTRFRFSQAIPVPEIMEQCDLPLPLVELDSVEEASRKSEALKRAEKEVLQPFDLTQAPLIRLRCYRLSPEEHWLLIIAHHTVADGWSLGVFLKELMSFYQNNLTGHGPRLPELPIQYYDYAHWQTSRERIQAFEPALSYWKETLNGELPVLELLTDQTRGGRQTFSGGTFRFLIPPEWLTPLEKLYREEDATLFMALLSVFYILLRKYSGQDDILIGTPVANRNFPELENLIGVFINTVVLRLNLSGKDGFKTTLRMVRKASVEAFAHQDLPFEKLVETLKPRRDLSRPPLFQVVFNLQNAPAPKLEIPGLEAAFLDVDRGVSQFDLTLMITKTESSYQATVEYNKDLFQAETISGMFEAYQYLLQQAILHPDMPIDELPLGSAESLSFWYEKHNKTTFDFPKDKCFHQLFEEQVQKTPNAPAVICENNHLSYQKLHQDAEVLADHLQAAGVGRNVSVGIMMQRSASMVTTLLAVMKSGGTYVPIHTALPKERVRYIMRDSGIKVLITDTDFDPGVDAGVSLIKLKEGDCSLPSIPKEVRPNVSPFDLAYIIYTSGSTGAPKGVMIQHISLVNLLWYMQKKPGIHAGDRCLAVTSISFDIAALEIFLPLMAGATVHIATDEMLSQPKLLANTIHEQQITIMQATPAIWQILLDTGWNGQHSLKALCGGEALSKKLATQLLKRVGSLWNMYGPTETTIWSSVKQITSTDKVITIGDPIGNTRFYILDLHQKPIPSGIIGELYIGGAGLAKGYLNLPQLTTDRFIPDPIGGLNNERLFKTGDNARYLSDGAIEILGRTDDQVKIQGNRVELGEIRSVLMSHPAVKDAIVKVSAESSGDKKLLAYYLLNQELPAETSDLRTFLARKLPGYMIPSFFIKMEAFPVTTNGKIDRKQLPEPDLVLKRSGYVAPGNETEQILTDIWQSILNIRPIGVHDNFFELGGASMQSLQIVAKANMYGLPLQVSHLFEHQTIAALSAFLAERQSLS